ncbi:MAG: hypothetical protein ACKO96_35390, partial [Flammeovirgaceae bacterium]
ERTMPGLVDIEDNHSNLVREYAAKNRCGYTVKGVVIKSQDVEELSMTKDFADFDENFIKYLRISIETNH